MVMRAKIMDTSNIRSKRGHLDSLCWNPHNCLSTPPRFPSSANNLLQPSRQGNRFSVFSTVSKGTRESGENDAYYLVCDCGDFSIGGKLRASTRDPGGP